MAVYFNDLTVVKNDPQQNCRLLPGFWNVVKKIQEVTDKREKYIFAYPANVNKPDEGMVVLQDSVNASGNWDLINTYASCFLKPFQEEGAQNLLEQIDEHTGGEAEYSITIVGGKPIECKMLGWAHYVDAITVGLASSQFWIKAATHPIQRTIIEDDQEITESVESICVTTIDQLSFSPVQKKLCKNDNAQGECGGGEDVRTLKKRVVVLGVHDRGILVQVLQEFGINPSCFEFIETGDVANYDITRLRNRDKFAAVMVGAVPHSAAGMGDATSVLDALRDQPGYPHVETLTETMEEKFDKTRDVVLYMPAGKLNVTKTSFRRGLMNLMNLGLI